MKTGLCFSPYLHLPWRLIYFIKEQVQNRSSLTFVDPASVLNVSKRSVYSSVFSEVFIISIKCIGYEEV
jgi:hypothetical protein